MRLRAWNPRFRLRSSLTPMIDVVFLLLVFFMLAARFAQDTGLPIRTAAMGATEGKYSGPPRLIDVGQEAVFLNGRAAPLASMSDALRPLMRDPQDLVVIRPRAGVSVQRMLDVMAALRAAGIRNTVLVEAGQ